MTQNIDLLNSSIDPFILFKQWFDEASKKEINDPNAMNLSTLSDDFKPSSRMILLKDYNLEGLFFIQIVKVKKVNRFIKTHLYL